MFVCDDVIHDRVEMFGDGCFCLAFFLACVEINYCGSAFLLF